ncbi:hypothetical protein H4R27_003175 [Coemansia aciculifera]|uniref:HMG box domain-containing protein n=1 Tax=Coemansia pectinata TaxID=1052879 RepID=A0A9W8L9X5_9FUNG|nr:hypothetical protein GGI19_003871 [Coemansia pectinata]KAJ2882835.1 hypothetical protein H4R27_003175 [Coemansia aciculifera]
MPHPVSPLARAMPTPPMRSAPRSPHYSPYSKHPNSQYASPERYYMTQQRHNQQQVSPHEVSHHQQPNQVPYPYNHHPPRYQQAPPPPLAMPQQPPKQQSQNSTYSSKIIQESGCQIYRYNNNGDTAEQSLHQIVGSNGKVYIEYIPGHSMIYIPSSVSPSLVMSHTVANSRLAKLKEKSPKAARPSNVFFKYRSHKLPELTKQYPKLNQTVISQMVADAWKVEDEEVKDRFKQQYKDEMIKYEIAKKLSRYQSAVIPREYHDEEVSDNLPAYSPYSNAPTHVSGPPSAVSNLESRHHSLSLTTSNSPQLPSQQPPGSHRNSF